MQKISFLTIVCCLTLMFTSCTKETQLETNPKNSLTNNISTKTSDATNSLIKDEDYSGNYAFDAEDSISIAAAFLKASKSGNNAINACYNNTPNPNQCGNSLKYSSCNYALEIWNDPTNLYLDLDFSSQFVGTRTDCRGTTCRYWLVPYLQLRLYNASGAQIGVIDLSTSSISTKSKTFTINIASLASYGSVACVSLSGYFKALKQCSGGCNGSYGSIQCVGTICVSNNACQKFCLQVCPSVCPTASVKLDKSSICGSGTVTGTVSVTGDASKTATTWTVSGESQSYTGNTASITIAENATCAPIVKTIHVKVVCTTDQSVIEEKDFSLRVNPLLRADVLVDNFSCEANIVLPCQTGDANTITWTLDTQVGTGSIIPLNSFPQMLYYTVSSTDGCTVSGSEESIYCLPFIKSNTSNSSK